jgi:AcrR family transcriptional regulator
MSQKTVFTKEAIVEAAFTITREEGWRSVTARSIAKRLGSSTMPIYSSMKSMEEIESEVRARAENLLLDYQSRSYAKETMLDMAIGYVTFARDERNLFRFLYVDSPLQANKQDQEREVGGKYDELLAGKRVASLEDQLPIAMRDPRVLKSWIFTHGLASMISSGVLDLPDERIKSLLTESGMAFFMSDELLKGGGK